MLQVKGDISVPAAGFLGLATCMLLLCCLSSSIIDDLPFFRLSVLVGGLKREVVFGLWGYCVLPIKKGIMGFEANVIEECTKPKFGYAINENVARALHSPNIQSIHTLGITRALIIYPIATTFTFLTFLLVLAIYLSKRTSHVGTGIGRKTAYVVLVFSCFSTFLTLLALVAHAIFIGNFKSRLSKVGASGVKLRWQGTIWLTVVVLLAHLWNLIFIVILYKQIKSGTYHVVNNKHGNVGKKGKNNKAFNAEKHHPSNKEFGP